MLDNEYVIIIIILVTMTVLRRVKIEAPWPKIIINSLKIILLENIKNMMKIKSTNKKMVRFEIIILFKNNLNL